MNSKNSVSDRTGGTQQRKRAVYSTPKLVEYGGLRDITLATNANNTHKSDNSSGSANKTNG